jgi:hypothetical protein
MYVNLNQYPSASKTYVMDFPELSGGLNLQELEYRLKPNQTPDVRNLWWQDGLLQCRDGQVYLSKNEIGVGHTCYSSLFFGNAFLHIGTKLYRADMTKDTFSLVDLGLTVPSFRGTFFRYLDWLFYKTRGGYYRIEYKDGAFTAIDAITKAYTPVIVINADPATGAGDTYQPENRLSSAKTVRYNAKEGVKEYHLPAKNITAVTLVTVGGERKKEGDSEDYTVSKSTGVVTFKTAPPVTTPATNKTVEITYTNDNEDSTNALNAVMDCPYAMVAGGDRNICILMAGSTEQPNAVFWNSNDNLSMNPVYFPITYYNLVGDTEDPVTGFGRQYSDLIVLKEHSVGKLDFTTQVLDERESISFVYTSINSKVGCDLPWSIQLVENNLVFCNTYQGVHMVRSSSAAYENNVECISRNVNGNEKRGLLQDVRAAGVVVTSFDDDSRYWLCVGGKVYLWEYTLGYSEPSWFYLTGVPGVSYFRDDEHKLYHMDGQGRVTQFQRVFSDYDGPIDKLYRFPTQHFGNYDRLKDVVSILVSVRSDTDTDIHIKYDTDYETRKDLTTIQSYTWRLFPRNLDHRCLKVAKHASVLRRRPGCRHVRHFAMAFSNDEAGTDLSIASAQIFYKLQGRER